MRKFELLAWGTILTVAAFVGLERGANAWPPGPPAPPGAGPRRADDRERAARHLTEAYRAFSEIDTMTSRDRESSSSALRPLLRKGHDLYRQAHRAFEAKQYFEAAELGLAANDAARGLRHVMRARKASDVDLPKPPVFEEPRGKDELRRTEDRIEGVRRDADNEDPFLWEAREVLKQARAADRDGQPVEAAELARGAEAWTHVAEHVARAARPE